MLLYHVQAAVLLCLWSGLRVNTNEYVLFHAFDYYYSEIWHADRREDLGQIVWQGKTRIQVAENYADMFLSTYDRTRNKFSPPDRSDIVNHHEYISYTLNKNEQGADRLKIMLNIYITFMAYQMALYFRICVIYYSTVEPDAKSLINNSQELFEYMEWFFNLLLKEKIQGYCNIEEYSFNIEPNNFQEPQERTYTYICVLLKSLNLNFATNANVSEIPYNLGNVYKIKYIIKGRPGKKIFKSLFPNNTVTLPANSSIPLTKNAIYVNICHTITRVHAAGFLDLCRYISGVSSGGFKSIITSGELFPDFSVHETIREHLHQFINIKYLLPDIRRQTFSGYGDTILRSNPVEMLRYMYEIREKFHIESNQEILNMKNSGKPEVVLKYPQGRTDADYVMRYSND